MLNGNKKKNQEKWIIRWAEQQLKYEVKKTWARLKLRAYFTSLDERLEFQPIKQKKQKAWKGS